MPPRDYPWSDEPLLRPKSQRPIPLANVGLPAPDGQRFPWGQIVRLHVIGNITVAEFIRDTSNYSNPDAWERHGDIEYHVYIDDKDAHHSCASLDSAVVLGITIKRRGLNCQAATMFDLMTLGTIPEEKKNV